MCSQKFLEEQMTIKRSFITIILLAIFGMLISACTPPVEQLGENVPPTTVTPAEPKPAETVADQTTGWQLVFSDDFNGTTLDRNKWSVSISPNDFFQWWNDCYRDDPANVKVSNGALELSTVRVPGRYNCGLLGHREWTGGMVRTLGKFNTDHGKIEMRVQFPDTKSKIGLQSALWMFPVSEAKYGKWPSSGEIDIAEQYGPFPEMLNPSLHYDLSDVNDKTHTVVSPACQWNLIMNVNTVSTGCAVPGATTGYHTYSVEWYKNVMVFKYDGKEVLRDTWKSKQGGTAPFDQPFYLNMTQGVGTLQNMANNDTPPLATMKIDYVKVWK